MALLLGLISLITSPLQFDIQITQKPADTSTFHLTTQAKNLTVQFRDGFMFADSIPVSKWHQNETMTVSMKCISHISLHFQTAHANSLVYSPTLCSAMNLALSISDTEINGCIFDISQNSKILAGKVCGFESKNTTKNPEKGPIYVAEPLELNEGGSIPLQWKNVYFMPNNEMEQNISHDNIFFTIIENARHGEIRVDDVVTSSFTYAQLLARKVLYRHDGSESRDDRIGVQCDISNGANGGDANTYTLRIKINGVNDAPRLSSSRGDAVLIASRGRRVLTRDIVRLTDDDDRPERVKVQVVEANGVHLEMHGEKIGEFTQKQLIDELVSLVDDGEAERGRIRLMARDGEARSQVLVLETQSTKVDVRMVANTGIKLLHHSSVAISPRNLSFEASIRDMTVSYRIVDMPDTGVVECIGQNDKFSMCTTFTQTQINEEQVRFRHTSPSSSTSSQSSTLSSSSTDQFSFQVEAGEFASMLHAFRIDFIAMNIKVFTREPFVLNATEHAIITRQNLFAWTFPKRFSAHNLIYHIDEPPKLGTLTRRIAATPGGPATRTRRIGVSSNFTQQDLDQDAISYKLHYQQYSIVNDFFVFRVVSPAVSSALMRFDIVYIPKASSVRLVNKTIVVKEGESASITTDFLSLSTPDDTNFTFRLISPTIHGTIQLKSTTISTTTTLKKDANFTSDDVEHHRLVYTHSGGETRQDECRLLAISRQNSARQVPLRLTFSIILMNDNAPRMASNNSTVYMVERGERVLHDFLLPWIDDDVDSPALLFDFTQNKDAAILSTVSPYLPLTSFTQHDIEERKVMIRHLGHHAQFDILYSVTDGIHTVPGKMHIVAAKPDVWIENSRIEVACGDDNVAIPVRITADNITVATNLDVRLEDVEYSTATSSNFLIDRRRVATFTQLDIAKDRVRFAGNVAESLVIRVKVADRHLDVPIDVQCETSRASSLATTRTRVIRVPVGGATLIDIDIAKEENDAIFQVVRHPQNGYLSLDHEKSYSSKVSSFTSADIVAGNVQYVHSATTTRNDSIEFRVAIVAANLSYTLTMDVEVFERNISISTSTFSVPASGRAPILSSILNITTSEPDDEAIISVVSPPTTGWIVVDDIGTTNTPTNAITSSVSEFSTAQIAAGRVWFVADGAQANDSVGVRACVQDQCTPIHLLAIEVTRVNEKPPVLTRNEVLRVGATGKALITNSHLDVEDLDTPSNSIIYTLAAQPSNGRVVKAAQLDDLLHNFTQFDIDQSAVAFIALVNTTSTTTTNTQAGGFSFHISDGRHRHGPEWFAIEMTATSTSLETNGRLIASPASATVIGTELLRANMPGTRPDDIVFTVTRAPKYGELLIDGIAAHQFTQTQINRRQVVYSTIGYAEQNEWSRRDSFAFRVYQQDATTSQAVAEKFRITTTYAALNDKVIQNFIATRPLVVSKGGSACFNQSHLDVSRLVETVGKEVVMIEIGTEPKAGRLEWLDNERRRVSWQELRTAFYLIYHHEAKDTLLDTIVFHVYAARESTRRTSRIRVAVDILVTKAPDEKLEIVAFPQQPVAVLNSGSTQLLPDILMTRHRTVPPQSIVYRMVQRGTNGCTIRHGEREISQFTQSDVNEGRIAIWHTAPRHAHGWHDVIVLNIEGNTRTLLVEIRPLDLVMKNHSVIEYPQGKTYVVLTNSHLGAFSNSHNSDNNNDRSSLKYRIQKGPENGTFYWVAGEKEAKEFSQKDIDDGRILYAQLNMHSYQDSFEFTVENETRDVVRNVSRLRVRPLVAVQPVIVEGSTATPLTASQINASALSTAAPRFFLTSPLRYGRLTFDENTNYSTYYFTYSDVQKGIVYYKADGVEEEVRETVELEIRADNVQPARFQLPITVLRADLDVGEIGETMIDGSGLEENSMTNGSKMFSENGLPIVILGGILAATIFILVCRRCGNDDTTKHAKSHHMSTYLDDTPTRLPPSPTDSLEHSPAGAHDPPKPPDLLGSTVFASVKQAEDRTMQTFTIRPGGVGATTTPKREVGQHPHCPGAMLDYAGTPPPMRLFDQVAQTQPTNHYWV